MPSGVIQWFPGHMAKTRRLMKECLSSVDLTIEILDARIPLSSRNPEIKKILGTKPILTLLSKSSMADPAATEAWIQSREKEGELCIPYDAITGDGVSRLMPAIRTLLSDKLARYEAKGMTGRAIRAMVVGIPNVGKSTFINHMAGSKKAKAENRPGVTVQKQWVTAKGGLELLDMPGVLWPKFEDKTVGENLAMTGAIKDDILDIEHIAILLVGRLRNTAPDKLSERYKLGDMSQYDDLLDWELFEVIGKKRGFLISGGEIDYERCANMLLDEFRGAKIGRISLELPPEA